MGAGGLLILLYLFQPALRSSSRPAVQRTVLHQASTAPPPDLSIVIPAYNEELRLEGMLQPAWAYFEQQQQSSKTKTVEWILVNDGSTDATSQVFGQFVADRAKQNQHHSWILLELAANAGKGAAVQAGVMQSLGQHVLMVDADGATDFGPGLEALWQHSDADVVIGTRVHLDRHWVRQCLSNVFSQLVAGLVGTRTIHDTQCGFKLFRRNCIPTIFGSLHLATWAFDIEVLYLTQVAGYSWAQVPVPWHEVEGSKLHTSAFALVWVASSMLRDMICVRLCYALGIWTVVRSSSEGKKEQ